MNLTKEYLLELRESAVNKRQQLSEMLQQANGAIDLIDLLLQRLEEPENPDGNAN